MGALFRPYTTKAGFTEDFFKVRDFIVRINQERVLTPGFIWGRWEWAFSLPYMDTASLSCIGIWEDAGIIVGLATYENCPGEAWFLADPSYSCLKKDMLGHACANMRKEGKIRVLIPDSDRAFQRIAAADGFRPSQEKESTAMLDISEAACRYDLPEGFSVTSLHDDYDLFKYNRVLWRGFNHGDFPDESEKQLEDRRISLSGPHANMNLNIAVRSPEGAFVSYCGTWYDPVTDYALVEPVATDPDYRMKGLGKAAVLEAAKRCGQLGAKCAYVGSSQQFYYSIGFHPLPAETWWEERHLEK
jgi:GNAT superfamily N-acetyltransferase